VPRSVILVAVAVVALAPARAAAQPPDDYDEPMPALGEAPGESVAARELSATVGVAAGAGDASPGGLRIAGSYLYQLSDLDWFDGGIAFTFGSGAPDCFRDRADDVVCDHGLLDGIATDLFVGVRRFFAGQGEFRPWLRPAIGVRLVRFDGDDLTGVGAYLGATGGVRVRVTDRLAVGGRAGLELGGAMFTRRYGIGLQADLVVGADVELALP
jgi:hypothetical protein